MIDASKLPTVPSETASPAAKKAQPDPPEAYARAPDAIGPQHVGVRPPAVHWSVR